MVQPVLDSDLVAAARKGKRDAVVEVLAMHYPVVWRMATGLTGRADVGRGVTKFVMQRSLRVLSSWKDDAAPTRWFHHHTLLTTRRTTKHQPDTTNDTFLKGTAPDVAYTAFIRAVRTLPMQQREAFILTHGEKLDIRSLAVAMDCSVTAAANHLREAVDRLRVLAPAQYDAHVLRMNKAYEQLGPDEELALKNVRGRVRGIVIPWVIGRAIRFIFSLILLAATIWAAWWVWRIVEHSLQR
ncbi:MAG TPA: sigma factor-like helix-turn-helix DNA-binding protein [Tepidisphaeraceae bacterium]|jgi:DNA-directed RNA polymerase specialized sigma24 family protein